MRFRSRVLAVWKDPVGSNIIAAAIIGSVSYLLIQLLARASPSSLFGSLVAKFAFPGALILLVLLGWHYLRNRHKILVFLSAGGTCRDPMAKAIAEQLLHSKNPRPRIRIRAAGLGPLSGTDASYAARYVIREMYGKDLLKHHRPELLTPELREEADLILVMDKSLLTTPGKTLPSGKAFLLKEFLGLEGDVVDPWPDGKDDATLSRYRACAEELRTLLSSNTDRILKALEV